MVITDSCMDYPSSSLCFNHSLANGNSTQLYHFPEVPERHFAEQLTRMDCVSINYCKNTIK